MSSKTAKWQITGHRPELVGGRIGAARLTEDDDKALHKLIRMSGVKSLRYSYDQTKTTFTMVIEGEEGQCMIFLNSLFWQASYFIKPERL
ncbi:MAG: hypothetical protein ABH829_04870 [archaeon]